MTTYATKPVPSPFGLPLKEIAPATFKSSFEVEMVAAPSPALYVAPSGVVSGATPFAANWIIYTRSVLSWSITVELPLGATMVISLGVSEYAPLVYEPPHWLPVALIGEGVWNVGSGLELPGNTFMRIRLTNSDESGPSVVAGSIFLRSL